MKSPCEIVVAGAGVVGMTLAAMLAAGRQRHQFRVTLIDAKSEPQFLEENDIALRVSAISAGSMQLFSGLGIDDAILAARRASPYRDMRVWDACGAADGPETLRFDAAELGLPELGHIVENVLLQHCLLARLRELDVELRFETGIAAIERADSGFELLLDDGEHCRAALLVGADGARSGVRASAGIEVDRWRYAQAAVVTHAMPERPHRDTAWQRFLPDGPLALLPLADGRVSIVWSTSKARAAGLLDADNDEFGRQLTAASDSVLGALRIAGPRGSFPLGAQHARNYVAAGLALVGDAAHTVHPLAGQGANLGLADAAALAAVIDAAADNDEYPADLPVLRRYERARKGANRTMLYFIDGLNRLFATDSQLLARIRGGGMRLFNRSGPVRRQAMRIALGLDRRGARL